MKITPLLNLHLRLEHSYKTFELSTPINLYLFKDMCFKKKQIELLVLPSIQNIEEISKDIPVKITKGYYSGLEFCFKNNKASILYKGRDIKTFSLVWLSSFWGSRDLATTVQLYLDHFKIPNTFVEQSTSKITDSMNFVLNKIPFPDTYYIDNTEISEHINDIEKICSYPLIMKDVKGCGGNNAAFITSREELLKSIADQNDSKKFLFQKYIVNDYDWGVLVANNKVVSAERSYPQDGEYRNNVGAKEVFVDICDIPEDIKDIALKAGNTLGLSWSRSDIIVERGTGKPYLLEVNRFPGITTESSEVTGACEFLKNYLNLAVGV